MLDNALAMVDNVVSMKLGLYSRGSRRLCRRPNRSPAKRVRFGEDEQGSTWSFRQRRKRNRISFDDKRPSGASAPDGLLYQAGHWLSRRL